MTDQRLRTPTVMDLTAAPPNLQIIDPLRSNASGKQSVYQIPTGLDQELQPESVDLAAELPIEEPCQDLGIHMITA